MYIKLLLTTLILNNYLRSNILVIVVPLLSICTACKAM